MAQGLQPIRRVVTGNDERGRSKVIWDGPAPGSHEAAPGAGRGHTNFWVWNQSPPSLNDTQDPGDLPYDFPGPAGGGHLRVVQSRSKPQPYDPAQDSSLVADHPPRLRPPGRTWDRGGFNAYSSPMHKTETVDYGILLAGERVLVLDDCELVMKPGDVCVQVGAWHKWTSYGPGSLMAFDMFAAKFIDGEAGLAQGNDPILRADPELHLPDGVRPARRIVTIDREVGRGVLVSDGPAPDVRFDPARPGFASARLWVTDSTPAKIVFESLQLPHAIEPPRGGTVMRMVTFPPDARWHGKVGREDVRAFFTSMGSPSASTYSAQAPHPYMQKTDTLEFCLIIEGDVVLVLDTQEVPVKAGDIIIQRGTNLSWSNRSSAPVIVAIASHSAK
jgi:mannose-6-phosphate isomerase-like protein (cupin superfamily)